MKLFLAAMGVLLTASACASHECNGKQRAETTLGPSGLTVSAEYETTGPGAAEGLSDAERKALADVLSNDPAFEPVEPQKSREAEIHDVLDTLGARRVDERSAADWRGWNIEEKTKALEELAARGNPWAEGALDALRRGDTTVDSLDPQGLEYEIQERVQVAREEGRFSIRVAGLPRIDGVEPMPFGDSMFGPWDTGTGSESP